MRTLVLFLSLLLVSAGAFAGEGDIRRAQKPVANQYIVVLEEGAAVPDLPTIASEIAHEHGGQLRLLFRNVFKGFSVEMTEARALAMSRDPRVRFVEENAQIVASATQTLPTDDSLWNLDRIDQLDPFLDHLFTYATTGAGVTAYVIDSGVMASHQEFRTTRNGVTTSRVVRGYDAVPGDGYTPTNPCNPNLAATSQNYQYACSHGTSVASVLGGKDTGVAKSVTIVPIRVNRYSFNAANQIGSAEDIIEGIDSGVLPDRSRYPGPAVANMSVAVLTSSTSAGAVDLAVTRMIDSGITVVTAATNWNSDACGWTPPRLPRVITVGGSMLSGDRDTRWVGYPASDPCPGGGTGSNWGTCVDIFAPAYQIRSAHTTSTSAYRTQCMTGTSFSSPMVAGVVALHLQNATTTTPDSMWTTLSTFANTGRLAGGANPLSEDPSRPSPDRLLYSNWFTQTPSYEGYHDGTTCQSIRGWAWDRNQPSSPIRVDLYAGSTWLDTLWANSYRSDLVSAGKGNGYHGWGIPAPASLRNGQYHTITAKYGGTDTNLFSTSRPIICNVSIFTTQTPASIIAASPGYEVATLFSSSQSGSITKLRFYRSPSETGTNTLRLWTAGGSQLASGSLSSGSGWVEVDIPDRQINAGTQFWVSVNTNTSQSKTDCGLSSPITNGPLTATGGAWGPVMGAFPTNGSCSNFFVDVRFDQ